MSSCAHEIDAPSSWVCRWAGAIRPRGRVLDVACGSGRHLRYLKSLGYTVVGVDRDDKALSVADGAEVRIADLEAGPWPFSPGEFDGVVVTNYLYRAIFPHLVAALRPGGVLIYETFALGNERYGRPSNPDFLLKPGELLERVEPLSVIAFEQGLVAAPKQALIQRVCAARSSGARAIALE